MKEELRRLLSSRARRKISLPGCSLAAVLVPIYYSEEQCHVVFIQRTERVKAHRGEISFPGGAYETSDKTLLDTALRESAEEIGLCPGEVEVLGNLDDIATNSSGYIISPFLGLIPWPYAFEVDRRETEEVFTVPVHKLLEQGCLRIETRMVSGLPGEVYYYHYRERVIWGATAKILNQFLAVFNQAMARECV
jgi:8-oxo-dGTP pyrophosphatase MutT (NUDIX family)